MVKLFSGIKILSTMALKLKILFLEDSKLNVGLALKTVEQEFDVESVLVESMPDFEAQLKFFNPDLVILAFSSPGNSDLDALKIANQFDPFFAIYTIDRLTRCGNCSELYESWRE